MHILVPNWKFLDGKKPCTLNYFRKLFCIFATQVCTDPYPVTQARFAFLPTILLLCCTADAFPSEDEGNYNRHGNENKEQGFRESPSFQAQLNK